ncbi:MAG: exopolyphosphatase [Flavobacteriales bacterium]|nr:exopolyphosphatase [Flavobacteriales bacterium]
MKFAAIDIGSNAIRILFYNVFEDGEVPVFKKISLTRLPIRLGEDVFSDGRISERKIQKLIRSMSAFKALMDVHEVNGYRAYATSAMREAENGLEVIQKIYFETGMVINIIDGKTEADVIFSNKITEAPDPKKSYLFIDVGGGSTEITLFSKNKKILSSSFNIGTVRMLTGKVMEEDRKRMKLFLKEIKEKCPEDLHGIGSGGNINRLHKLAALKEGKPLSVKKLKDMYNTLKAMSYHDRTHILGLNTDRADVIIPACEIFLYICKFCNVKQIIVPKIGLSDGIIKELYLEHKTATEEPA